MSDSYSFKFLHEGEIHLQCRSFEGVGRAEVSTVHIIKTSGEAELILASLQDAISVKKRYDRNKTVDDIARLEGTIRQAQIDLEMKRKELNKQDNFNENGKEHTPSDKLA